MSLSAVNLIVHGASVRKVITAAQTLTLNATPINLLGAPGAGRAYIVHDAWMDKPAGTVGAGGGNLNIRVGTVVQAHITRVNAFPAAARRRRFPVAEANISANGALNVSMSTGALTGNDVDLVITVIYSVIAV